MNADDRIAMWLDEDIEESGNVSEHTYTVTLKIPRQALLNIKIVIVQVNNQLMIKRMINLNVQVHNIQAETILKVGLGCASAKPAKKKTSEEHCTAPSQSKSLH